MEYFSKPGICGARVERSGRLIKLIYCAITQVVRFGICLIAWEVAWVAIDFEVMTLPGISFILTTINVLLDVFYLCFLYWEGFSNLELEIIENSDFFSTKWCRVIRKIVSPLVIAHLVQSFLFQSNSPQFSNGWEAIARVPLTCIFDSCMQFLQDDSKIITMSFPDVLKFYYVESNF